MSNLAGPDEVPCDVCEYVSLPAEKSCLVCLASFCEHHLEPHGTAGRMHTHTLIEPVADLDKWVCRKHNRPLDLFCKDDQECVCVFCVVGDHRFHTIVAIEEGSEEWQTLLQENNADEEDEHQCKKEEAKVSEKKNRRKPKQREGKVPHKSEKFTEHRLRRLHRKIKSCLTKDNPDVKQCVAALDELDSLHVTVQHLWEHPQLILILRKICKMGTSQDIVEKASVLYSKLKAIFQIPVSGQPEAAGTAGVRKAEETEEESLVSRAVKEECSSEVNFDLREEQSS